MNSTPIISALAAALCAALGCSSKPSPQTKRQVTFQSVQDPVHELCMDDTLHRTDYFTVPDVRFEHSTLTLNGSPLSQDGLLDWANKKYLHSAEPTLWVQVSSEGMPLAERTLSQLVQSIPKLQLRRIDPEFSCRQRQKVH